MCIDIYPDWDGDTLTTAHSDGSDKMSIHASTFGLRIKNGNEAKVFTELVRQNLPMSLQVFVENKEFLS